MVRDFKIGEREFKLNKINALKQFKVVRKLAPILSDFLPALAGLTKISKDKMSQEEMFNESVKLIGVPLFSGIAKLSDKDAEDLLVSLCSAVEMKQAQFGNWMYVAQDGIGFLVSDLELPDLLQIAGRSLWFNLENFTTAFQRLSPEPTPALTQ